MRIGEFALASGLTVKALHYYDYISALFNPCRVNWILRARSAVFPAAPAIFCEIRADDSTTPETSQVSQPASELALS